MAYSPTIWVDNSAPALGAVNLNHAETGIANALDKTDMLAKGDLLVATASGAYARLAVGANNTVAVADSLQTTGVKWVQVGDAQVAVGISPSKLAGYPADVTKYLRGDGTWPTLGIFSAYTPAWTATTAPALGNGTLTGRFFQIGKLVVATIEFTAGSTTTFGTGVWNFSLPVTGRSLVGLATAYLEDSGIQGYHGIARFGTSTISLRTTTTASPTSVDVSATTPFTWGAADLFNLGLCYEAA